MFFQSLKSGGLVSLGKRSVSHDVRVHYHSESALAVWHYDPLRIGVGLMTYRFAMTDSAEFPRQSLFLGSCSSLVQP